jgi:two-component system, response regulator
MGELSSILLVEDNEDDAELTMRAFHQACIANPLVRVADGVEALDYLFGRAGYADRDVSAQPVVVLLDLKLPRLDGIDVLKAIRANDHTCYLPVVMLTSSDQERDRIAAYRNRANSYIKKPVDYEQFVDAARHLGQYWAVLNTAAPAHRDPGLPP